MEVALGGERIPDGSVVSLTRARLAIEISYAPKDRTTYHIFITDPDAINGRFVHYAAINIPEAELNRAEILYSYEAPAPPPNSGPHHYTVSLYETRRPIRVRPSPPETETDSRENFRLSRFVARYGLSKVADRTFIVDS